jgi:predicted DNA-binding protein (UPF0251 family)
MGATTKLNVAKPKNSDFAIAVVKSTKINFVNVTKEEVEAKRLKAYKYAI